MPNYLVHHVFGENNDYKDLLEREYCANILIHREVLIITINLLINKI